MKFQEKLMSVKGAIMRNSQVITHELVMIMENDKLIETVENNSLRSQINIKQMLSLNFIYSVLDLVSV